MRLHQNIFLKSLAVSVAFSAFGDLGVLAWLPTTIHQAAFRRSTDLLSTVAANKGSTPPPSYSVVEDDENEKDGFPSVPPEFEVIDSTSDSRTLSTSSSGGASATSTRNKSDPKTPSNISWDSDYEETPRTRSTAKRPKRLSVGSRASWMERNAEFLQEEKVAEPVNPKEYVSSNSKNSPRVEDDRPNKTFRRDFRGTRVFVQGLPPDASWQDVKDHFKEAGTVVFASVSIDPRTGESKGHGIVQYETTEMAHTAIAIMRNYPMNGYKLYVREDVQEAKEGAELKSRTPRESRSSVPTKWKCADEENASYLSETDQTTVLSMVKARDDARRRRQFDVSDALRDELKMQFGVHLDDRLKMWWTSMDGKQVPKVLQDIKGEGRWGLKPWRQIPTTPENDACVNPALVSALLDQRDIARREKDFSTADALLEEARTSPDGDLSLRIHDESRTWRIWTDAAPPRPISHQRDLSPEDQCIAIVEEFAPEKVDEVKQMLQSFPGREWQILKKLRQRYIKD
eukprot:scaffold4472_cov180-Amphora_coffeaeformis.AAC.5